MIDARRPPRDLAELSDTELAALGGIGDRRWLEEVFRRYRQRLLGCAHRMVAPEEVEDAVQEIAERILRGLPRFRGESSLSTWVYSVARHTCLDVRRRRRRPSAEPSDVEPATDQVEDLPDDAFGISVLACRTALALQRLTPAQRDVVLLRLGEGLSTKETAEQLGVTVDSVKARLRRARVLLRDLLSEAVECPRCGPGAYSVGGEGIELGSGTADRSHLERRRNAYIEPLGP